MDKTISTGTNDWLWVACLLALGLGGCMSSEPEHQRDVGKLDIPLVSTGSKGTQFALAGTFSLSDPEMLSAVASPMDPTFTTAAVLSMNPIAGGPYALALSNWSLYELTENPKLVPDAMLLSPATLPVSIIANQTATATFSFSVPGSGTVVFRRGTLDIDFTVAELGDPVGALCMVGSDCESGLCTAGVCTAQPTCMDGLLNGAETGVDCGGTCPACGPASIVCVKINEVSPSGPGGGTDEFVEIYNRCNMPVDIGNAILVYRAANATVDTAFFFFAPDATILAGEYQVYANSGYHDTTTAIPFGVPGVGLAPVGGGVALKDYTFAMVDSVGYGNATNFFVEGMAVAAPLGSASISRSPNGVDTNDNSADFKPQLRTPGGPNL